MASRTLLIGLDGATFTVLKPLLAQGVMPCLKELLAAGVHAELNSVVPPLTPPAWTSLMTGRSPGNHGILDFMQFELRPDRRQLRIVDARDVACETVWSMVVRQGLKATVLNFPLMYPAPAIAATIVPGWVPWRHLRLACHPSGLYDELKALPGFNARELAMDMAMEEKALEGCQREEDYEEVIKLHIRRERQWFNILLHLMRDKPAELTAVLFDGVDKLQHFCWRFIDEACFPESPSPWELRVRALCLDYFREVDGFIREIVALGGPEATTVLASDHGFGPTVEVFYLNAWLHRHGYLAWANAAEVEQKHPEVLGLGTMARRFYEIDWDHTTAYCPTPSGNGIYLSPPPGVDYHRFRRRLMDQLHGFTDPAGHPIVTRIWTREEAFAGRYLASAPDLTLSLRDGGFVSILPSETLYTARDEPCGAHRPQGIFAAAGPGIRRNATVAPLSIMDITPLLLYSLDLPVPADLEGSVPAEIYQPAYLESQPLKVGAPTRSPAPLAAQQTAPEQDVEAEVLKQLQALGYME